MLSARYHPQVSLQRRIRLVTAPVCDPISYRDWQSTLKISVDMANPDIMRRIRAGTRLVENHIRKVVVGQVWDMYLDDVQNSWPGILQTWRAESLLYEYTLELLKPPLLYVNGIYTRDDSGYETLVDPSTYWVSDETTPGRIALQDGCTWPYHRGFEGFRIRMTVGYVYAFQSSGNVITTYPPHGYLGGEIVRIQTGHSDNLPQPLEEDTDYQVTNVSGSTFQLLDMSGNQVTISDSADYDFVGIQPIPETIRRAIVITSAIEIGTDSPNKIAGQGRYAPVTLPITAADLLEDEIFHSI